MKMKTKGQLAKKKLLVLTPMTEKALEVLTEHLIISEPQFELKHTANDIIRFAITELAKARLGKDWAKGTDFKLENDKRFNQFLRAMHEYEIAKVDGEDVVKYKKYSLVGENIYFKKEVCLLKDVIEDTMLGQFDGDKETILEMLKTRQAIELN